MKHMSHRTSQYSEMLWGWGTRQKYCCAVSNKVEHLFALQSGGLRAEWIADHLHFFCPFTASETKWCHSNSQHWHLTSLLAVPASLPGRYQSEFCRSKCLSFGWAWASKMQFVTSKEYLNVSHSATGNILFIIPLLKILDVWHRAQRGIKYVHT